MELIYKGESRCFVFQEEDIQKVYDTIKEMDEFEFSYTPENWVTVFNSNETYRNGMVYNGKFDINVPQLIDECGKKGFGIIIISTNIDNDCF